MTNSLDRKPKSAISQWRVQKGDDPAWLWWLVAGSSIAAHILLLNLTFPFTSRLSSPLSSSNPIAIDLIELTPDKPAANPPAKPATATPATASPANPAPVANPSASAPAPTAVNSPRYTPPAPTGDIAFAPSVPPIPSAPIPPVSAPTPTTTLPPSIPAQTSAPLPQLEPAPLPPSSPAIAPEFPPGVIGNPFPELDPSPIPESTAPDPALPASPTADSPAEGESIPNSESAAAPATPTPPQVVALPIDVPVPDVSETLPVPSPSVAQLEQVETPQQAVPVMLTASVTPAEPAPDANALPDAIARPLQDSETFAADPRSSPCLITPEVIPYLGETVAVQVTTNEAGQATDASVRQPSSSPVYDDLAVCMVKQWQFEPAISQGNPVPSNALVVAVRIQ